MRRATFLFIVAMGLALAGAFAKDTPPNVLLVLTDDIGWGDLRCYNPQGQIPTPAFDALASAGMRFTDAHSASAVCAPTRYSLISGNYPWRGRTTIGAWKADEGSDLLPGQRTFAHRARERGYRTAIFGKAGFGASPARQPDGTIDWSKPLVEGPEQWGFDFSHILLSGHQAAPYFYHRNGRMVGDPARLLEYPRPRAATPETEIRFGGVGLPDWDPRAVGATLLDAFEEFVESPRPGPFLAFFNTAGAHAPNTPPGAIRGTPVRGRSGLHAQADMVVEADVTFGHLIAILEKRGLLANTVVILTSDNGGIPHPRAYKENFGHDAVGGLRGGKGLVWEGGHRVPLIVRWGDGTAQGSRVAPGSVSDELVGVQDLYATVAELVGAPPDPAQGLDSVSLLPELLGTRPADRPLRDHFIASSDHRYANALAEGEEAPSTEWLATLPRPPELPASLRHPIARAYREGKWSLKFDKDHRPASLHDLSADRAESNNLIQAPEHRALVGGMVERYYAALRSVRTAP